MKLYQTWLCFNTTIVSVELSPKCPNSIEINVSIQLLFRWNEMKVMRINGNKMFQYNYCFGGTKLFRVYFNSPKNRFNTTIVSVEQTIRI